MYKLIINSIPIVICFYNRKSTLQQHMKCKIWIKKLDNNIIKHNSKIDE
jgi:hypothetical protein